MAMCKCRDMEKKRCKVNWGSPDPFRRDADGAPGRLARKAARDPKKANKARNVKASISR